MVDDLSIRNKPLYERLRKLAEKAFTLLPTFPPIYETRKCLTFIDDGVGNYTTSVPCFWSLFNEHSEELSNILEFTSCMECIKQDSDIHQKIGSPNSLIHFLVSLAEISSFSSHSATKKLPSELDVSCFNRLYKSFEKDLYSGKSTIAFAPLWGFESEVLDIDLGEFLRIKRLSPDDLIEIWHSHYTMFDWACFTDFQNIKFCLVEEQVDRGDSNIKFDTIVTSLRLWKSGDTGYDTVYRLPKWCGQGGSIFGSRSMFFGNSSISLKSSEVEGFKDFYTTFKSLNMADHEFLNIALSRFNSAYQRKSREDQLIDYVIAFEALFSEGSGDLSYKVSTRVARLLETDGDRRRNLYDIMRGSYEARNDIVHGNKHVAYVKGKLQGKEREKVSLINAVTQLEEYLRMSVKEILNQIKNGKDKDTILREIDFQK